MASTKSNKKQKVGKDDLKRLMKERAVTKTQTKKIDSPLAKYNSMGQLLCVLCNMPVKSEILWNAHLLGRTHKENLESLKKKATVPRPELPPPQPPSTAKRKTITSDEPVSIKKSKDTVTSSEGTELPPDFFDPQSAKNGGTQNNKTTMLGLADYDDSEEEEDDVESAQQLPTSTSSHSKDLPPDFFDKNVTPSSSEETPEVSKPATMAEALPEGFFDDPKQDAKVRQVEYKDKMEEEWEMFQRAMKEENTVSEAIIEEDEELKATEKYIDEIDEQMHQWSKIHKLAEKKEEIMKQEHEEKTSTSDDSDADEKEFEDFLDWRSKKAMK